MSQTLLSPSLWAWVGAVVGPCPIPVFCCMTQMASDPSSHHSRPPSPSFQKIPGLTRERKPAFTQALLPAHPSLSGVLGVSEGTGHMSCRQHTYFMLLELGFLQLLPDGSVCCQATLISRGILSRRICVKHCVVLPLPDSDFRLPPT